MRFTIMALGLTCIGSASMVEARGLEYGPRIAISIPTQDAGKTLTSGVGYGLTATFMESPRRGFGVDIAYHRWPGSPDADRRLDALFSLFSDAPISGSRTTVSVVQATIHQKIFAFEKGPVLPWMKVGAGVHRLNAKLELPIAALQASGVRVSKYGPDHISHETGFQIGAGLDFAITAGTKLSLDGSYHLIITKQEPFLTAFTIGACLLDRPRQATTE